MKPLRSKHDLLALVAQHAPTNACARAATEGRATLLGGFTPAGKFPCYIVRIEAKHRQSWIMQIDVDEENRKYVSRPIQEVDIPWEDWAGSRVGKRELIDGDKPEVFAFKRMVARCHRPYPRMPR